jgi:RHS repeat-associated protein
MGVTPIAGFNYAYDNEGNRQFENKLQDSTRSEAYQYDANYRLITYQVGTLAGSTVPVPSTQTNYNLDSVGNWQSTFNPVTAVTQTRAHNSTNELIAIDATTLTYDLKGNVRNDGSYTYGYDEENRLTMITRNSDSAVVGQYQYDARSRRIQKIADPAGAAVTTNYFYDDTRVIEEQVGGATQATYVYGNYIDEVLTMDRGGQTYYYHQNAPWSVEAITNSAGAAVERYEYDAYGGVSVLDGTFTPVSPNVWGTPHSAIGNPWAFTGRQLDEEAGLYYYRARYYDSGKGRFLQRDPLEYAGGMNLYEYAASNPIDNVDPQGLIWEIEDHINCLGYASGRGCTVAPKPGTTDSLKDVMTALGWTCKDKGKASKDCTCKCSEFMLMLYIYKYRDNPDGKDPFTDTWIHSNGKNDYHAIKCNDQPVAGDKDKGCKDGWSYVPYHMPKMKDGKPNPDAVPHTTTPKGNPLNDADAYWTDRNTPSAVPGEAYCCCKPMPKAK